MPIQYCQACDYRTDLNTNFDRHLASFKHQRNIIDPQIGELTKVNGDLTQTNQELIRTNEENLRVIKSLTEQCAVFKDIVEKAATKTTTVNHNHNILDKSRRTTNTVNILSPEPVRFSEFHKIGNSFLTADLALKGDEAMANAMMTNVLTDSQGRSKVTCTDLSRQNFKYRDETTGEVISDPKLVQVCKGLRTATKRTYKDIQMDVYDGCHTNVGKDGKGELDDQYLFQSRDRALFRSGKVVKHIAQKTYTRKAVIKFDDTRGPLLTREEWAAMSE